MCFFSLYYYAILCTDLHGVGVEMFFPFVAIVAVVTLVTVATLV